MEIKRAPENHTPEFLSWGNETDVGERVGLVKYPSDTSGAGTTV